MGRRLTVSFDLDGTLTSNRFVDSVWLEGLPRLVSQKRRIDFPKAQQLCIEEYSKAGDSSLVWYQFSYWLGYFGLTVANPHAFVAGHAKNLELYEDVHPVLQGLKREGHELILFSNAARIFLDVEVSCGGIAPFFDRMISVSDDWGLVKADPEAYARLKDLAANEVVHIGDHIRFDYEVPMSVGIPSYHICRDKASKPETSLVSLHEFLEILKEEY